MLKNKKDLLILLSVSLVLLLFISIAFASLSATLNINVGGVTSNPFYWDVSFLGNYDLFEEGTSSTGRVCGAPTIDDHSITFSNITLSKPDDKCIYYIDVVNHSDFPAYLKSINTRCPSNVASGGSAVVYGGTGSASQLCGGITYSIRGPDKLEIDDWIPYIVTVAYNSNSLTSQQTTQSGAKITMEFVDDASQAWNSDYH